ncbi:acyltransferase family protein [Flavobacterium cerinum]|uniref:Acyltransferase n=1 Tax=Flavobacterium cerinum TaxID=2502784 RepID=A0A3S3QMA2_9FLAO|nr:acyltransferase [Flavobacterium cerinum]RWX02396.1 acyltransferase [Flavobacterium cerinum]
MDEYLSLKLKVISFVSMLLVVFLHSYNLVVNLDSEVILLDQGYSSFIQNFFSQGICRVAVPLFFSISGYLFFLNTKGTLNEFVSKFNKRLKTIVVPYLFWSVSWLLFFLFLQSIPQLAMFFYNKNIIDYTAKEIVTAILIHPIPYQLWFLRDLMCLVILAPLLFFLIKKTKYFALALVLIIWFFDLNLIVLGNESLFFFVVGSFISIHKNEILAKKITKGALVYTLIWLAILLIKTLLMQYRYDDAFVISFLHKVSVLIGILAVWSLYDSLVFNSGMKTNSKVLNYSFFIFVLHEPMLQFLKKILFYLTYKNELISLIIYFAAPIITIIICLFAGFILKRIAPKFYLFICGGR